MKLLFTALEITNSIALYAYVGFLQVHKLYTEDIILLNMLQIFAYDFDI